MTRRVLTLIAGELTLVAAGLWTIGHHGVAWDVSPWLFLAYAAGYAALGALPPLYVELKRHACWFTLTEIGVLVGLFALGPFGFVVAAMVAEGVAMLRHPQPPLKSLFNFVHMLGGFTAAAVVFTLLGQSDPLQPAAWLAGIAAVAACIGWDMLSAGGILAISENRPYPTVARQLAPAFGANFVASALLGTAALVLFEQTVYGPLLFAPIVGALVLSTQAVSKQRGERLRFEQLYEASANLARLVDLPDMLSMVATEAMSLMTGSAALCCTRGDDGDWTGVLVSDRGSRAASGAAMAAVAGFTETARHGEMTPRELPREARKAMPQCSSLVWASGQAEPAGSVFVVVFRELPVEARESHRAGVLDAFMAHAASVVANARMYDDVQKSLKLQVELNRQKSEFIATVSHELRTPLTSMIGSVQTLKRLGDALPDDKRLMMLDMGLSQGARLRSLIEDLLLVAAGDCKAVQASQEPIVVADMFSQIGAEMSHMVGDCLRVAVAPEVGTLTSDTEKLRRIIVNLVENAHKYAPGAPIDLEARVAGERIEITVTDQGDGILPEHRERVFERFVQLDQSATRRQGGTGLGLHLCRQLAGTLGGTLLLDDGPDGGARFTLALPRGTQTPSSKPGTSSRKLPPGMARSPFKQRPASPESALAAPPRPEAALIPALPGGGPGGHTQ